MSQKGVRCLSPFFPLQGRDPIDENGAVEGYLPVSDPLWKHLQVGRRQEVTGFSPEAPLVETLSLYLRPPNDYHEDPQCFLGIPPYSLLLTASLYSSSLRRCCFRNRSKTYLKTSTPPGHLSEIYTRQGVLPRVELRFGEGMTPVQDLSLSVSW